MSKNMEIYEFQLKEIKSKTGKVLRMEKDNIIKEFESVLDREYNKIKEVTEELNKQYGWDKSIDLKTEYGLGVYFAKEFYINTKKFNGELILDDGKHNYSHNGNKDIAKDFRKYIDYTLLCDKLCRDWGYGEKQLAYMHVHENKKTSTKFIDYILNNNLLNLDEELDGLTYGYRLRLYTLRSSDVKSAKKLSKYKIDSELILSGVFNYLVKISVVNKNNMDKLIGDWYSSLLIDFEILDYYFSLVNKKELIGFYNKLYGFIKSDIDKFINGDFNEVMGLLNDTFDWRLSDDWRLKLKNYFFDK